MRAPADAYARACGVRKGLIGLLSHRCGFGRIAPSPSRWANFWPRLTALDSRA